MTMGIVVSENTH